MKKFLFFFVFKDNFKPALSSQVTPLKRKYLGYNKRLIPGSKHAIVVKRVKTKIAVQSEQRWILSWWERCLLRKWGKKEACSHSFSLTQLWAVEQLSVSASSSPVSEWKAQHLHSGAGAQEEQHIKYCYPAKLLCAASGVGAQSSVPLLVSKHRIEIKSALTMSGVVLT